MIQVISMKKRLFCP